jgi:hypothetical protein
MTERRIARVVIASDSVGGYEDTIATAAQIATWLDAALHGVFIEDEALLNLTAIPAVRHVGPTGEIFTAVDERVVLHQFAAHAARMRRAIEKAARAQEIVWSFDTVRGRPSASILHMSGQDLLVIEAESRPFTGGTRFASRLMATALESEKPTLVLRNSTRPTNGVVAMVQSTLALAAPLIIHAARLASASNQSLTLLLTKDTDDERAFIDLVGSVSQELANRCYIERSNQNALANIATAGRLLIVEADPAINSAATLRDLLVTIRADILFLR